MFILIYDFASEIDQVLEIYQKFIRKMNIISGSEIAIFQMDV